MLGLGELHNNHLEEHYKEKRWICSESSKKDKDGKDPDPAAGVAILLSNRMADRILATGCVGSRIVYARLAGPVCNLFIIVTYIPHRGRKQAPFAIDTISQLQELLKTVHKTDCIILMGDLNCELQRNVENCTGQWSMTKRKDNGHGEEVLDLMRAFDLFAVDTLFKPERKAWGKNKKMRYCNATYMAKDSEKRPRKLDYICVSNRWKSMVKNVRTKWGPSYHRFGHKFDHGLLSATWRWKKKKRERYETADFNAMDDQSWLSFDRDLRIRTQEMTVSRVSKCGHIGHVFLNTEAATTEKEILSQELEGLNTCLRETIKAVVPTKKHKKKKGRVMSEETKVLHEKRRQAYSKKKPSANERKKWNRKIVRSCRDDYRKWVAEWTDKIEKEFRKGNTKAIYEGVRNLCGTKKPYATKQPTKNAEGQRIASPEELANEWKKFSKKKFSPTEFEKFEREFAQLPKNDGIGKLEREEFEKAVKHLKNGKATGADGIPVEVFKKSAVAKNLLFAFLKKVWDKEYVPVNLAIGVFVMIFKKGAPDDFSNYRCICLLNHAYKIFSAILMRRLTKECEKFLSDWQAGFRAERGCRDNILLLRTLYDFIIRGNKKCVVTFIDYKAAFDSVSHKFIDSVLARAKVSRKCRAIFRAIYAAAKGMVRVNGILGKKIFSEKFDIGRGVVQGDIVSPLLFILALDQIIQKYDRAGKGVKCGKELTVRVLGYADDAAMAEEEAADMTTRLTAVADGSEKDADMTVRMDKTFTHHVQNQEKQKASKEEALTAQAKFKYKCDFCERRFKAMAAMYIHRDSYPYNYGTTDTAFEVEKIVGVFGRRGSRFFKVKYAGYPEPEWNRGHLLERDGCTDAIRAFWADSGLSPCKEYYECDEHRCDVCGRVYNREQDLKSHKTRKRHHQHQIIKVSGTAKKVATQEKLEAAQKALPLVKWGEEPAENRWAFEYLGAIFTVNGSQTADVHRRIAMARQRHGKMRHIWQSSDLHLRLKLRLYVSAVCSTMIYGSEAWMLDKATLRALNGANSKMLSVITGKSIHDEAKDGTRTYDVVAGIRATRLRWLGKILVMDEDRMVLRAVKLMFENRREGDILMDAPDAGTWEELRGKAKDKKKWGLLVRKIKDMIHIETAREGEGSKKRKVGKMEKTQDTREMGKPNQKESGKRSAKKTGEERGGRKRITRARRGQIAERIRCNDGFTMFVQASGAHYCTPKSDRGPYTHVEVNHPNEQEPLLAKYGNSAGMMYLWVPATVIKAVVMKHLGLATNSGKMPDLIEVDEDGCQWAAAAEPPSTESSEATSESEGEAKCESSEGEGEDEHSEGEEGEDSGDASVSGISHMGSLTSAIHMGAPPPSPPPMPASAGEIPPPIALTTLAMSPITATATATQPTAPKTETPMNAEQLNDLGEAVLYVDDRDVFEAPSDSFFENVNKDKDFFE